ncbi:hypothetical protein ONZ45_g10380 [Pleurotus djamor]|nr:hypothetical protein ONZ45_g10380 [Pleurotus djamor]
MMQRRLSISPEEASELYAPFARADNNVDFKHAPALGHGVKPTNDPIVTHTPIPPTPPCEALPQSTSSRLWQSVPSIHQDDIPIENAASPAFESDGPRDSSPTRPQRGAPPLEGSRRSHLQPSSVNPVSHSCLPRATRTRSASLQRPGPSNQRDSHLPRVDSHHSTDMPIISSSPISPVLGETAPSPGHTEKHILVLQKALLKWKDRAIAAEEKLQVLGSDEDNDASAKERFGKYHNVANPLSQDSDVDDIPLEARNEDPTAELEDWRMEPDAPRMFDETSAQDLSLPSLAMWLLKESAVLSALQRSLSESTIAIPTDGSLTLNRQSHLEALSMITSQRDTLNDWLLRQIPPLHPLPQHKQADTPRPPVGSSLRTDKAKTASKRAEEKQTEEQQRQKEMKDRRRQLHILIAKTREDGRRAREKEEKLWAEIVDNIITEPLSPSPTTPTTRRRRP